MKHLESILGKKNDWWRYLLMFLVVFVTANVIGSIPLGIAIVVKRIMDGNVSHSDMPDIDEMSKFGLDQNLTLALLVIPFIISLIAFAYLVKPLHNQSFKAVINGTDSIRWHKFFFAFGVWITIMALYLIVDMATDPDNFILIFSFKKFVPLVFISLLLIPFQSSFEEIMFRGYLSQGVAAWTRNRIAVVFIPAVFFGLMHIFNPEIREYGFWLTMPQYVIFGVVFGLITVLDDGIESAMGAHAANNIFLSIFVTFKSSALQTPALFHQRQLDPLKDLIMLVVISVLFVYILFRKYKWDFKILTVPVGGSRLKT